MQIKLPFIVLSFLSLSSIAEAEDIIRCESNKGRRTFCDVRHAEDANIELDRQLSDSSCVEGFTWGRDRRGIWVEGGCRAEFAVYYPGGGRYDNRNGYGYDNYDRREDDLRDEKRNLDYEREKLEQEKRNLEAQKAAQQQAPRAESCPPGFTPSEQKCSNEERRRGCKDMRLPGGLGCVRR